MREIVLSTAGYAGITIAQCQIEWLKANGIHLMSDENHSEFQAYQMWANENRVHPLLIDCLKRFHDDIEAAMKTEQELDCARKHARVNATHYISNVAENIIKRKGKGHVSSHNVEILLRAGKTFEEILHHFSENYRHKSHIHPIQDCENAVRYLQDFDKAEAAYQDFIVSNGFISNNFVYNQWEIKEYDDTQFMPKLVLEKVDSYWSYGEEHEIIQERLHLIPLQTKDITEVCLASFVAENDTAGLLQYLRERGVSII